MNPVCGIQESVIRSGMSPGIFVLRRDHVTYTCAQFFFFSLRQFFQICPDIYEYTPTQYVCVSLYFPEKYLQEFSRQQEHQSMVAVLTSPTLKCQVYVVISG